MAPKTTKARTVHRTKPHTTKPKVHRKPNKWAKAVGEARKNLKLKGFVPIKKGSALYNEAKRLM